MQNSPGENLFFDSSIFDLTTANIQSVENKAAQADYQVWESSQNEIRLLDLSAQTYEQISEENQTVAKNLEIPTNGESDAPQGSFEEDPRLNKLSKLIGCQSDAKVVLRAYIDEDYLSERGRSIIVQGWIKKKEVQFMKSYKGESLNDWIIEKEEFKEAAREIQTLFPTEDHQIYYTEFCIEKGIKFPANGKLLNRYEYRKVKLRENNIIKPSKKKSKNIDANVELRIPTVLDAAVEKIQYLEVHSEDIETVKLYWAETFNNRITFLKEEGRSVHDYLEKFKALREQLGKELIELDFDLIQPGKGDAFTKNWPIVKNHLSRHLSKLRLSADEKTYLNLLPTLQPDNQNAVIFYLLKKLIPAGKEKTVSKKRKRSGVKEASFQNGNLDANDNDTSNVTENKENKDLIEGLRNDLYRSSYLIQVPVVNEENITLEKLRETFFEEKLTLQPTIVITGSLINIQETYVVVNNIWYKTESFLAAISLTFKSFYAFDCEYPYISRHLWQLLQISAFDIKSVTEKVCLKVKAIAKEISLSVQK